jgi:hypothetical protein
MTPGAAHHRAGGQGLKTTTNYHTALRVAEKGSAALIQKGCAYVRKGNNKL